VCETRNAIFLFSHNRVVWAMDGLTEVEGKGETEPKSPASKACQAVAGPFHSIEPELAAKLHDALQSIARAQFAGERVNHTLQPTALVNELWLRMLRSDSGPPTGDIAFRAWAARAMRNILVSHARGKNTIKRGSGRTPIRLQTNHGGGDDPGIDLLELEDELDLLEKHNSRAASVVEMRLYGGMTHAEVGVALGISASTAEKRWAMARSWLSLRFAHR
jgi:RNA polymerase sigma factor (TIGR02999 family)